MCWGFLQLRCTGFSLCGARRLGHAVHQLPCMGSTVVVPGLQRTGSVVMVHELRCSQARGNFPDRNQTHVFFTDRRILIHRATRETLSSLEFPNINARMFMSIWFFSFSVSLTPQLILPSRYCLLHCPSFRLPITHYYPEFSLFLKKKKNLIYFLICLSIMTDLQIWKFVLTKSLYVQNSA